MNLIHISNTFNLLVQESEFFQSYHFGYHSDININTPNNSDISGNAGKMFPHLTWVAPVEGELILNGENGIDYVQAALYFYNLQDYKNDGDPVDVDFTLLTQWNTLKARAVELLHGFNAYSAFRIKDKKVKWFTDSHAGTDRLICVGAEFEIIAHYGCDDYQDQTPSLGCDLDKLIDKTLDLEAENA